MLRRSTRNVKKSNEDSEESNTLKIHKNLESQIKNDSTSSRFSDSEQEIINSKKRSSKNKKISAKKAKCNISDSSSSESDIENYLQPVEKIDLNSSFFIVETTKNEVSSFDKIEKEIFSGVTVTRLSESDTSEDELLVSPTKSVPAEVSKDKSLHDDVDLKNTLKEEERIAKLNFQQLQAYQKKIEDAKKSIELYNIKHAQEIIQVKIDSDNIDGLLAAGEAKQSDVPSQSITNTNYGTLSDSEPEDWEEIKDEHEKQLVPKKELEITVEMPTTLKKKKGNDLLSAVKRRLNRIKKENQILIHKVHLLCWIAHGNYVNSILNDESMIALGLSLIPSEKCYPAGRIDLDYLEQILKWYKRTIKVNEKLPSKSKSLNELLTEHIDKKEVHSKTMLVLIFIIILRSLGIQCRLILSLQVEPLRPPSSDLHFLGKSSDSTAKSLKGEISKHSTTSHAEKDQVEINVNKSNQHLNPNKSSIETTRQDCLGPRRAIVNIQRMNYNSSIAHQSNKKKCTDSENDDKTSKVSSNNSGNKDTIESKHAIDRRAKQEKYVSKSVQKKSNNSIGIKKNYEEENQKFKTEKISNKSSDQKSEKVKSQWSQGVKAKKLHDIEDGKLKIDVVVPKVSSSKRLKSKGSSNDSEKKSRSKSTSIIGEFSEIKNIKKTRSRSTSSKTGNISKKVTIPQLDGSDDNLEDFKGFDEPSKPNKTLGNTSFENFYSQIYCQVSQDLTTRNTIKLPQLDGANDEPKTSNPNLKVLRKTIPNEKCKSKNHRKSTTKPNYKDVTSDSDDYFRESPTKKSKVIDKGKVEVRSGSKSPEKKCGNSDKEKRKVNLNKLRRMKVVDSDNKAHSKDVTSDIMQLIKGRISEQKHIDKNRLVNKRKANKYDNDSDDSDYVPEVIKKKYDSDDEFYPKIKEKQRLKVKKEVKTVRKLKKPKDVNSRKVISSDSEYTDVEIETKGEKKFKGEATKKKIGNDVWLEVFLETEEKWTSVDVIYGQIHCINELYSRATHPVSYVLSWDNTNHIKDITRRYCQNYNTVTRKCRIDSQWWEESLKPFIGPKNARDREEDDELNRQQLEKPLPTTISEYKNHPLYALERHLLKFEALYPPNAPPLGFVRNEPVYSRDCVHVCHSRDIWLKQAKVVKLGEKPYKIVKARPKYDKLSNTLITDQNLDIFGPWQVEDYVPPTAKNGIVPRNAFGNVDLFKPSMLPKKCVHLQLPGLNKTARKMNIDCASAIVGFDFHGGWSHPVYDGFVVCEEYEDQLIAAWNIEQEEIEQKEQEKYEKRVYGNWKKLIRGLLIKERLKVKYGFGEVHQETSPGSSKKNNSSNPRSSTKKRRVISDSSESEKEDKA
ncbi:hypothetical protein WA026_015823 [Henosepilachna vigintioctopunctata]|uniref:Uncharacterized protein n=1 Tax=Henosepilachna vigintioctopunctata TaxID=420089 RepID=A0AAW1V0Q1_9CUCU